MKHGKTIVVLAVLSAVTQITVAQVRNAAAVKDRLFYYRTAFAATEKPARTYTNPGYKRPNNQLMSWPNYPLTPTQAEQRMNEHARENKLSNKIAKDIITAVFSKKKPVAVIPKF